MYYFVYCRVKYGVDIIFCIMIYGVEFVVFILCDIFYCFKVVDQFCLVGFLKLKDNRKQEFGLVDKECMYIVYC